jgi:hypothetical protein
MGELKNREGMIMLFHAPISVNVGADLYKLTWIITGNLSTKPALILKNKCICLESEYLQT